MTADVNANNCSVLNQHDALESSPERQSGTAQNDDVNGGDNNDLEVAQAVSGDEDNITVASKWMLNETSSSPLVLFMLVIYRTA